MGLASSRVKPENWNPRRPGEVPLNVETLAEYQMPIETRDILHHKLSRYATRFCLSRENQLYIEYLFFAHISKPVGSKDAYWSEKDFLRFYSAIPNFSIPRLPLSCSVLYRLLLRLGSFPYITEPAPYLTYDIFCLGLIMLSGQYIRFSAVIYPAEIDETRLIECQYRRMVFQAMAETSYKAKSSNLLEEKSDSDDEDLFSALKVLKNTQQWEGPNPCIGFDAAPLPSPSSLPSSLSTNLDGKIAWDEMKDLLETLLVLKFRRIGIRVDHSSSSTPDLRQALDSIIAAVDDNMPGKTGKDINWPTFNILLDTLTSKALEALPIIVDLLFTPLGKPSADKRGGSSTIQNSYQYPKSLDQFIPLLKGKSTLLTLPILSQILCCVNFEANPPFRRQLRNTSFVFSGNLIGLVIAAPKFKDVQGPKEFILLLSGMSIENEGGAPPREVLYAVVCLDNCYDPFKVGNHENASFGAIIQLAPILRQFLPSRPLSPNNPTLLPRMEFGEDIQNPFEITIKNGSNKWAKLALQQDISTYAKIAWVWGEQGRREESFKVETIELIIW